MVQEVEINLNKQFYIFAFLIILHQLQNHLSAKYIQIFETCISRGNIHVEY